MPFLLFLKAYWKPIAIVIGSLTMLVLAYSKGARDCRNKLDRAVAKEVIYRVEDTQETRGVIEKTQDTISENRQKNPKDDRRDSCILSNDPFSTDCL